MNMGKLFVLAILARVYSADNIAKMRRVMGVLCDCV